MDTIRARRGHRQRQRHARTEPNRMRPSSRRALLRAFPGSRFRFRKQRRPAFGHACSGSAALTSHSIPSPTSLLFLPHFARAAPLRAYSQPPFLPPTNASLYLSAIPPPPSTSPLGIYVFICSWIPYSLQVLTPALLLYHTALSLRPLRSVFIYIFSCALSTLYSISVSSFPYCSPSSCCIYCKPVCVYVYMYVRATLVKE